MNNTPEEKAKELVEKFMPMVNEWEDISKESLSNRLAIRAVGSDLIKAKQCAAICVQEIINEFPQGYKGNFEEKRKAYWQSVLKQINQP